MDAIPSNGIRKVTRKGNADTNTIRKSQEGPGNIGIGTITTYEQLYE